MWLIYLVESLFEDVCNRLYTPAHVDSPPLESAQRIHSSPTVPNSTPQTIWSWILFIVVASILFNKTSELWHTFSKPTLRTTVHVSANKAKERPGQRSKSANRNAKVSPVHEARISSSTPVDSKTRSSDHIVLESTKARQPTHQSCFSNSWDDPVSPLTLEAGIRTGSTLETVHQNHTVRADCESREEREQLLLLSRLDFQCQQTSESILRLFDPREIIDVRPQSERDSTPHPFLQSHTRLKELKGVRSAEVQKLDPILPRLKTHQDFIHAACVRYERLCRDARNLHRACLSRTYGYRQFTKRFDEIEIILDTLQIELIEYETKLQKVRIDLDEDRSLEGSITQTICLDVEEVARISIRDSGIVDRAAGLDGQDRTHTNPNEIEGEDDEDDDNKNGKEEDYYDDNDGDDDDKDDDYDNNQDDSSYANKRMRINVALPGSSQTVSLPATPLASTPPCSMGQNTSKPTIKTPAPKTVHIPSQPVTTIGLALHPRLTMHKPPPPPIVPLTPPLSADYATYEFNNLLSPKSPTTTHKTPTPMSRSRPRPLPPLPRGDSDFASDERETTSDQNPTPVVRSHSKKNRKVRFQIGEGQVGTGSSELEDGDGRGGAGDVRDGRDRRVRRGKGQDGRAKEKGGKGQGWEGRRHG